MRCPLDNTSIVRGYNLIHTGVDFGWYKEHNQPVYACDDGIVIYNRYQTKGGYVIIIKHNNGLCSVYGHLLKNSQTVKEGHKVKKGQKIAKMGASGKVTGEHLHFSIYKGTKVQWHLGYVNPLKYINIYSNQFVKLKNGYTINHTKKVTAKDGLNIRTGTNTKSKIVYTVPYNSEVETYGLKNKWNIVDNVRGYYCSNRYLKK